MGEGVVGGEIGRMNIWVPFKQSNHFREGSIKKKSPHIMSSNVLYSCPIYL